MTTETTDSVEDAPQSKAQPPQGGARTVPLPTPHVHHVPESGALRRAVGFLGWVFSGFGLIPALLKKRDTHFHSAELVVYSAHRAFGLWALILAGFVGSAIVHHWNAPASKVPVVMGWIYLWVLLYTFISALFDVGTLKLLLWVGIFTLIWISSKYIEELKNVHVLSGVIAYMRHLKPRLDPGMATVVSWLLLGPWVGALFLTFTNGRKRFTPNEISEWQVGEGCELTDRSGLKFRTRYRDVLETILGFGAGDLIAYDANHAVTKRYENVLFLVFLWPKLDSILHERSALVDNAKDDPVEVESVKRSVMASTPPQGRG